MHKQFKNIHTVGMKKLLYFVVSVLSLSVIFASGWAAGAVPVQIPDEQPAIVRSKITDECPDCPSENDECPDEKDGCPECPDDGKDVELRRHGFKLRVPFPPKDRDGIIRIPKIAN